MYGNKKVFSEKGKTVSIKLLDTVIILGIAAMAILIPLLSYMGGFTLSFEANGGSYTEPQTLRYGEFAKEPLPPTKEDHVFLGWYIDRDCTEPYDFTSMSAKEDLTVFALWKEKDK